MEEDYQFENINDNDKGLDFFYIGLGWKTSKKKIDLDAMINCFDSSNICDTRFSCNYSQLQTPNGAIIHYGDNKTGGNDEDELNEDCEIIEVRLSALPPHITLVKIKVIIYDGLARKQHFGQVEDAYIRLLDKTNKEKKKYEINLSDKKFNRRVGVLMGSVYKNDDNTWKFVLEATPIGKQLTANTKKKGLLSRFFR